MIHAKQVLSNQLLAVANDPSWHQPFKQAVETVTEEEAFAKPGGKGHSIAELTQHLLFWNAVWQARFRKRHVGAVPPTADNEQSFVVPEGATFRQLREELVTVLLDWQELLDEEVLEAKADGFPVPASWWELLSNAAIHNSYHIGQIVYIRNLLRM